MEITSPAGNFEKGKIAFIYGAHSVYVGYPNFSLRSGAEKFNFEELQKLIDYANHLEKKVFLAINIFAHNKHIKQFKEELLKIKELSPHGLILSDPGLILMAKEALPDMHITLSTQANTTNYQTIKLWEKIGINRVVLARELSLKEIAQIRENTLLELEIFVHGAVCMAYSGRCFLSGFMTEPKINMTHTALSSPRVRHANLGDCIQPCRFKFALIEENRKDIAFPIWEDAFGTYLLSAKDLCLINRLKELKEAGVDVIKVEGRMKSLYYVANITRVYKKALDLMKEGKELPNTYKEELFKVSHRGYSEGFTFLDDKSTRATFSGYQKSYRFYALLEAKEGDFFKLKVFNGFSAQKTIEIIGPDMKTFVLTPKDYTLFDQNKKEVLFVRHQEICYIQSNKDLATHDIIRIKIE